MKNKIKCKALTRAIVLIFSTVLAIFSGVFAVHAAEGDISPLHEHNMTEYICDCEYEYANSVYHWVHPVYCYECIECGYRYYEVSSAVIGYEEHDFSVYANGTRYCSDCGEEDEFYYR